MANLHRQLCIFHDRVALTAGKKATLRTARDTLRKRIREYFRNTLQVEAPKFREQGSYAMNTVVNPIDNEYDIDDGVYLQHLDNQDSGNWPAAATVHQWLAIAADGFTNEKPIAKRTCVRVRIAGQYHVDLPSYGELTGRYRLAVKGEAKWIHSDPLALTDWFRCYVHQRGEQLRRIVRYLKSWADFQSRHHGRMAGGLLLTVLAAHHFHAHERDDLALAKTIEAISETVHTLFFVLNPVDISEELTAGLTETQKERFKDTVRAFADNANGALVIEDDYKASKLWRKQLGDRFPLKPSQK
jgi:hypothetical protein